MWVAICTKYEGQLPASQQIFGPFDVLSAAESFSAANTHNFDFIRIAAVSKPPKMPQIHPNQAEIGDYIDPSVAN